MAEESIEFHFPAQDAGRMALELADVVRREDPNAQVYVKRTTADAMDVGTVLIMLLGTPVVTVLARGVANWITKRGDPELIIKRGKDEIVVQSGLSPEQKVELIKKALAEKPSK